MLEKQQTSLVTLKEALALFDVEFKNVNDEPEPTLPPPPGITFDQLTNNIKRWKELRETGCTHMQSVISMIQAVGDAVWYYADYLDDIEKIVDGGVAFQAEGQINPDRASTLRQANKDSRNQHG